jgi:TalC/MipB family fructose-6-phosphate aldolase
MLYLDGADRAELAPLLATGLFHGVTTNPKILAQAGLTLDDVPELYGWAIDHGAQLVFAQALGTDVEALRRSARWITRIGERARVKVVATTAGLTVAKELADDGHEVLVTAVYHPTQALAALAAGARFIAPYVGRAGDNGRDGHALVATIAALAASWRDRGGHELRILAASLRTPDLVANAAAAGAQDVTVAVPVAWALLEDPLTVRAAAEFEELARGHGPA